MHLPLTRRRSPTDEVHPHASIRRIYPAEEPAESADAEHFETLPEVIGADVVRPMPRRKQLQLNGDLKVALPRSRRVVFRASVLQAIGRLFYWLWGFVRFYAGNLGDLVRRRSSVQRRAERLRRTFENAGPTFAKLAQQLSMRADMLPYEYCAELSKMLDRAATFPTAAGDRDHRAQLGCPLADVFTSFRSGADRLGVARLRLSGRLRTGERSP